MKQNSGSKYLKTFHYWPIVLFFENSFLCFFPTAGQNCDLKLVPIPSNSSIFQPYPAISPSGIFPLLLSSLFLFSLNYHYCFIPLSFFYSQHSSSLNSSTHSHIYHLPQRLHRTLLVDSSRHIKAR